jgi:hypothetical protein
MLTVDCPWCEGPMALEESTLASASCEACAVRVELAPDPLPEMGSLAA